MPEIWRNYRDPDELSRLRLVQADNRELLRSDFAKPMELIGAELRRLRAANGYSLESVARTMRMSKYRLCRIEHGLYPHFGLNDLCKLSAFYGVLPTDLLSVIPDGMFDNIGI